MKKILTSHLFASLLVGLASAAGMAWLYSVQWEPVQLFELRAQDYFFIARNQIWGPPKTDSAVVFCNIDDEALGELGSFPIPRTYYEKVINKLTGARMIGFDVMFFEESPVRREEVADAEHSLNEFVEALGKGIDENKLQLKYQEIIQRLQSPDVKVCDAARRHGKVLFPLVFREFYAGEAERQKAERRLSSVASKIQNLFFKRPELYSAWFSGSPFQAIARIRELKSSGAPDVSDIPIHVLEHEALPLISRVTSADWDFVLQRLEQLGVVISRTELEAAGMEYWHVYYRCFAAEQGQEVDPPLSESEKATYRFLTKPTTVYEENAERFRKMSLRDEPYRLAFQTMFAQAFGGFMFHVSGDKVWEGLLSQKKFLLKPDSDLFHPVEQVVRELVLSAKTQDLAKLVVDKKGRPFENLSQTEEVASTLNVSAPGVLGAMTPLVPYCLSTREPVFIIIRKDLDGSLRRYPLVVRRGDRAYFALGLVMACDYVEVPLDSIRISPGHFLELPNAKLRNGLTKTIRIPIDEEGNMIINWAGEFEDNSLFRHYGFNRVVSNLERDRDYPGELKDKLVLIGLTATGTHDFAPMPFGGLYPLVGAHANVINTILTQNFIYPDIGSNRIRNFILICVAALVVAFTTGNFPQVWSAIVYLLVVLLYFTYGELAFYESGRPTNIVYSFFAMSISFSGVLLYRYITEERQKKRVRGMFSTMVSPDVLHYMQEDPDRFKLAGEERMATMFFSDVAGFTTISEKLNAEDLAQVLNDYLTPMSDIILQYGGYIDKYEGDAIMADFGVPVWSDPGDPDSHAWKCCWAALEQQAELQRVRKEIYGKFGVEIDARMGINTGKVSAGNMGSHQKFQYTVMGDAVNQAARFEPANKPFNTHIMIGEPTFELARDKIEVRFLTSMIVKGKTEPVKAFELLAKKGELPPEKRELVELFERAWALHAEKKFPDALQLLDDCLKIDPEDGPSRTYRGICLQYQKEPPPESWTGEFIQTSK